MTNKTEVVAKTPADLLADAQAKVRFAQANLEHAIYPVYVLLDAAS